MLTKWIKNRINRIFISIIIALTAVFLAAGKIPSASFGHPATAWWGTMYPGFCFSERPGKSSSPGKNSEGSEIAGRKISFWLAKALDW
ncbi:MAG: hypothetical protein Q4C91_15430 [Eubacteriales bacterium]|nr:hypothetical protein [Eubacteriales bacterium]